MLLFGLAFCNVMFFPSAPRTILESKVICPSTPITSPSAAFSIAVSKSDELVTVTDRVEAAKAIPNWLIAKVATRKIATN